MKIQRTRIMRIIDRAIAPNPDTETKERSGKEKAKKKS
jgi:hypothetical protein